MLLLFIVLGGGNCFVFIVKFYFFSDLFMESALFWYLNKKKQDSGIFLPG